VVDTLVCWGCGASLAGLSLPLCRTDECPSCRRQLHVCRLCLNFAPHRPKKCRQEEAEEVRNKEQANFCDWFKPRPGAFDGAIASAEQQARNRLDDLFRT
jgi:hypothetical protein